MSTLDPAIRRATDRLKPAHEQKLRWDIESRYGGGLVGTVTRQLAEAMADDLDRRAMSRFALIDAMASLAVVPPTIPQKPLPRNEGICRLSNGQLAHIRLVRCGRISADEVDRWR